MKKTYKSPAVSLLTMETEGMIAQSIKLGDSSQTINTNDAYSQKKGKDIWGNEDIWK